VIVIDGFIACRLADAPDQGVGRIVPERDLLHALTAAEIARHCLPDEERQ